MKKHILTLVTTLFLSTFAFAQNGTTKLEQLPNKAQQFVKTYFNDYKISYIITDQELIDTDYKIRFDNDIEIEFNSKGEWTDISGNNNCLPTEFILTEINNYIKTYHKEMCITDIEKDFNRIKVELNNNLEIEFNSKGKFISYDD